MQSCSGGLQRVSRARAPLLRVCLFHCKIQAIPREFSGSKLAAKERSQGRIPSVVFKQENGLPVSKKQLLTTEKRQIVSVLKAVKEPFFFSRTFGLEIRAGSGSCHVLESGTVLPIKVHRNPETGQIFNLVFVWADEDSELKVDVPVVFTGEDLSPGLKKGGYLNMIRTSLKYICPTEHIPPKIEVDLSNLDIGDRVFMQDIKVHPSLKLLSKNEKIPICKIVASKSQEPTEF